MLHVYNLFLAGIWAVLGLCLLVYHALQPDNQMAFNIGNTHVSLGLVALALAAYNLLRWWLDRSTKRRACKELYGARRHVVENPNDAKPRARVDPDFDFGPGLPKSR